MYPDELFNGQQAAYEVGDEEASEHFRNGLFHWWLKRQPGKDELRKLIVLSVLEPDPFVRDDVRRRLAEVTRTEKELQELLRITGGAD